MEQPKFGFLFDLDGVLVDTETSYTEFYKNLEKVYPTGVENFPFVIKGTTLDNILATYFPDKEVANDVVLRLHQYESEMAYPIYDGVMELLDELSQNNFPSAIVTSSDESKMKSLKYRHPRFLERFTAVVTATDVTKSKPDPQGYLLAAERIGVPIERCFVFEDSLSGMAAGRAAGAKVISMATTLPAEKVVGEGCFVAKSMSELKLAVLLKLMS
ncbi:MAG: HAD family phosphatase [Muribaculum sp.]|nr:HAD family phosphatase [Muribaculaceae bacterium]MCM1080994.1 HAD family phosphatase [Muribaculum sp.]